MTPDTVTVLRARGRRLAKLIRATGEVTGYDSARTFDFFRLPVADLDALAQLLARLASRPDCCVVRGEPIGPVRNVRRLLHPDPVTGDAATLRECPRRWLALDMEGIALLPDVPASHLLGCARLATATLPAAFGQAACIVQASASHGFRPDMRLRLWFWCSRPLSGPEVKRWLAGTPADPSIFGAAQPIYTATPVISAGVRDPLGTRLTALPGAPLLHPPSPAALAPPPRPAAPATPPPRMGDRYLDAALVSAVQRIASADKRHPVILSEARSLARFVRAGTLSEGLFMSVLRRAGKAAGKNDPGELESIAAWALANAGEAARV